MIKLHIEEIKEIDKPNYCVDLEVEFTRDGNVKDIKWETTIVDFDVLQQFYYDHGLQYRMIDSSNPFFEGGHRQQEWTADFLDEVADGYLEDILKEYLIKILK
jgi:hypothetical protein